MKGGKFSVVLLCSSIALAGCASRQASEAPAAEPAVQAVQDTTPVVEGTATSLNIRATASSSGAVIGTLKRGERARAPQPAAEGWLYVEPEAGGSGYVAAQYVRVVEAAPAATPAPAAAAAKSEPAPAKTAARPAPPGSPLARITPGMTEAQVVEILGAPTTQQNYMTGKAWIPFYYGPDTGRLDYRYKGIGMVVFSRNRYSSDTKVIRTDYDPSEDGQP